MIRRIGALTALLALVCVVIPVIGRRTETSAAPITMGRVHESFRPVDGKIFVLIIGSDARSGNPVNARADAIHLVGINAEKMRAGILNFPRDSYVNVPGRGSSKINDALAEGGPVLLARTLEELTGIRIDYWALTAFEGFEGIVRDLKGVDMYIPKRVDDNWSGAHLAQGKQTLSFWEALAYVRSRHAWAGGDVTRTTHQADFLIALLKKLRRQTANNPARIFDWIAIANRHVNMNVPADEQFELGVLASQLDPKKVGNRTVPVSIGAVGAASVVFIQPGSRDLYRRLRENAYL